MSGSGSALCSRNGDRRAIQHQHICQRLPLGYLQHGFSGRPDESRSAVRSFPDRLHLEITESAYTDTSRQLIETLGTLRRLGFVIEMDDFWEGGYSSLNMLAEMPIDVLKLDMKFIQTEITETHRPGHPALYRGPGPLDEIESGGGGCRDREQLERLQNDGCDYAQGYYFAKPMPVESFVSVLTVQDPPADMENSRSDDSADRIDRALLVVDEDEEYRAPGASGFSDCFKGTGGGQL